MGRESSDGLCFTRSCEPPGRRSKLTTMSHKNTHAQRHPEPEKQLIDKLLDFYWQILQDTDMKPADRIASAKRLEALLQDNSNESTQVFVTLNLPGERVNRAPQTDGITAAPKRTGNPAQNPESFLAQS